MRRARSPFRSSLVSMLLCLALCMGCAWKGHVKKGDAFMASQSYDDAAAEYIAALRSRPDDAEIQAKLDAAQVGQVELRATQARTALERGQDGVAIELTAQAYAILPGHPSTLGLIDEVVATTGERARAQAEAGNFAGAMAVYDAILGGLPSARERVEADAKAVVDAWIAHLSEAATKAEADKRVASVFLYKAKIAALSGQGGSERDALREQLDDQLRYVVQVKVKSNDAGAQAVAGALVGERSPALLWVSTDAGTPTAVLSLGIGKAKFATDKSNREQSAQYQSGVNQVENPFYKMAQDDVLDEERRLVERENDVLKQEQYVEQYTAAVAKEGDTPGVSTGAEQNLSNAQSRLESNRRSLADQRNAVIRAKEKAASTERTKEEPVYSTHTYNIVTHVLNASATVKASIKHSDARPALDVNQLLSVSAQDDAHPAQSIAGIAENPLDLPSKDDLANQLWNAAIGPVDAIIGQSFTGYRQSLLAAAEAETAPEAKLELLLWHLITNPTQTDAAVLQQISELSGVPDAAGLAVSEG